MIKIYKTILSLYKEKYSGSSKDFKEGFRACLTFLEIGIRKGTTYNLVVANHELEEKNSKLIKQSLAQRREINKLNKKLNHKELIVPTATDYLKQYQLDTVFGSFNIVINADKETIMMFWFYFMSITPYKTTEECKSKFLTFLQGYSSKEFSVYKDLKTAKKELGHDNKSREIR